MPRLMSPSFALLLAAASVASGEPNPNIRFGLPAPAKPDSVASREAFLIPRPQYVLSYNAKTRTPNWVCWRLRESDIGNAPRSAFEPEPALPLGVIARVTAHDCDGSGFGRGHLCLVEDRSASTEDSWGLAGDGNASSVGPVRRLYGVPPCLEPLPNLVQPPVNS
jgi:endonuclease G, mitochondrial